MKSKTLANIFVGAAALGLALFLIAIFVDIGRQNFWLLSLKEENEFWLPIGAWFVVWAVVTIIVIIVHVRDSGEGTTGKLYMWFAAFIGYGLLFIPATVILLRCVDHDPHPGHRTYHHVAIWFATAVSYLGVGIPLIYVVESHLPSK